MNDSREVSDPGISPDTDPGAASAAPGTDAAPDTRSAVLAAARDLFAARGYDGASIRAITTGADANLGAVTYHFGSKEALYHEVLGRALTPLLVRVRAAAGAPGPALDRAGAVVEAYCEHLATHPDLPRFLLQQITSGRTPPPPVAEVMRSILGAVSALIRQGQAAGEIRPGDPVLLTLSLLAQPIYLALVREPVRQVVGLDMTTPDGRAQLVQHAREFVRAGLSAPAPEAS